MKLHAILPVLAIITTSVSNSVFSENLPSPIDHPMYRNGTLYVPRVDTEQQAGHYLDATLEFDSASGMWKLLDFYDAFPPDDISKARLLNPEKLEVIVTGSSPIQVFLKASVKFGDGCIRYGWINQRRVGDTFEIVMHREHGILHAAVICADPVTDEKVIPLQVYGLPAGTYEYNVNGTHTGTFSLSKDNTL